MKSQDELEPGEELDDNAPMDEAPVERNDDAPMDVAPVEPEPKSLPYSYFCEHLAYSGQCLTPISFRGASSSTTR